ncbi:hypothetical protein RHMOL_Rhmol11G0216900 [Rhododendron molle]|uniref:Uncharacterized protein n=1 Tax=Rhododendron molle TaxID=49168 RepID=A0ACC0LUZ3_RHOML|nr:hypothetical protein RHMOL_Rhmol11G0216900 [Rhododendron molle]
MAIFNFQILLYSLSLTFCIRFPQTTSLTFNLTDLGNLDQNVNIRTSPRAYRSTGGLEVTPNTLDANLQLEAGKASKESDVYSFGVVALEIACGRKPCDIKVPEFQMGMVEWVWDLYGIGRLLEAADPKLGPDFVEREMEGLMIVGLWCAHPDHNFRPKIRQVTTMVLKVDLQCPSCYRKIKKVLAKFPLCCSPKKIRDKLCCKDGKQSKVLRSNRLQNPKNPKSPPRPKNPTRRRNPRSPNFLRRPSLFVYRFWYVVGNVTRVSLGAHVMSGMGGQYHPMIGMGMVGIGLVIEAGPDILEA